MKTARIAKDYPIVCAGGSAVGLDAYICLLKHLLAFVQVSIKGKL